MANIDDLNEYYFINYWTNFTFQKIKFPEVFVREQAYYLFQSTNELVDGLIETTLIGTSKKKVSFYLHAPLLDNYKYLLLSLHQDRYIQYPVEIKSKLGDFYCKNEELFLRRICDIFANKQTVNVIMSLYEESKWKENY